MKVAPDEEIEKTEIDNKQIDTGQVKKLGVIDLFKYSETSDVIMQVISVICACMSGILVPASYIIFGEMTDTFVDFAQLGDCFNQTAINICFEDVPFADVDFDFQTCLNFVDNSLLIKQCLESSIGPCLYDSTNTTQMCGYIEKTDSFDFLSDMSAYALQFVYLAIAQTFTAAASTSLSMYSAQRQGMKIRKEYFAATLRQEVAYYDTVDSAVIAQQLSQESKKIQDAIGEKFSTSIKCLAYFLGGCGLGFYYQWRYALAICAFLPFLGVSASLMYLVDTKIRRVKDTSYAKSNVVAEEVFSGIRTVAAFGKESHELKRYNESLLLSKSQGIKFAPLKGLAMGALPTVMYAMFGFGFWYGGQLIIYEDWKVGEMMTCLLVVLVGVISLSLFFTNLEYFTSAVVAAEKLFHLIDRESTINYEDLKGVRIDQTFIPNIRLDNVTFQYPTRDQNVLDNISITVKAGQTVALVGESGSGKSTVIQLLQRFYNYNQGAITIGGVRIEDYAVEELRSQIGIVNQEPILFNKSIADNIRLSSPKATDDEIRTALREANALEFVEKLPQGINTIAGQQGGLLSGGQKQRICIARVLSKKPKIVLLDEATSALDLNSEAIVQQSLEKMGQNRTVVVVAHRLTTIRNADCIYAMKDGKISESGTHEELIESKGYYNQLWLLQNMTNDQTTQQIKDDETKEENVINEETTNVDEKDLDNVYDKSVFRELMKMNSKELIYIIFGCLFSLIGGSEPFFAVAMGDFIHVFAGTKPDNELEDEVLQWALVIGGLGLILLVAVFLQYSCLGKAGEELTYRIRSLTFESIVHQDMTFFDKESNTSAQLQNRLATDGDAIQGATGTRVANVIKNIMTLVVTLVIGFYYSWQIALVSIVFLPIIGVSQIILGEVMSGAGAENERLSFEAAQVIASESTKNIRTVTSLQCQQQLRAEFASQLAKPKKDQTRQNIVVGFAMGFEDSSVFLAFAACFWFGAWLIDGGYMESSEFDNIFKAMMGVVFGAMVLGQNSSFMANYGEAIVAGRNLLSIIERNPDINVANDGGGVEDLPNCQIKVDKINFAYPTRQANYVMKDFEFELKSGETVALVGESGQGKSTLVQLILRFYDTEGDIFIDGMRIKSLNVSYLRSMIGLVSQEPTLFNGTIRENILYGTNVKSTEEEVQRVCQQANILEFTDKMEHGLDTNVGESGGKLSGGQKQRVAIARALIRNPKIMLFDEATSALDNESEATVKKALDQARIGKTCLVIAHRLSSISYADKIGVLKEGKIIEYGSHQELMKLRGAYFELMQNQT